jgi:hypothetical protein
MRQERLMGFVKQVVIDCKKPSVLARFWVSALEDFEIRPYDDEEIARLAALGYTPETDPAVILDGPQFEICFQRVELERGSKTPVHFDVGSADWRAEVDRLTNLGATVEQWFESHAWMRDPEGNDFCVVADER